MSSSMNTHSSDALPNARPFYKVLVHGKEVSCKLILINDNGNETINCLHFIVRFCSFFRYSVYYRLLKLINVTRI